MKEWQKTYRDKKAAQLGMKHVTADWRLKKALLYHLACKLNMHLCYRCGESIDSSDDFTVDHKKNWLNVDPALFWDMDNIAFSHKRCNVKGEEAERVVLKGACSQCGRGVPEIQMKPGKRRCKECFKKYHAAYMKQYHKRRNESRV